MIKPCSLNWSLFLVTQQPLGGKAQLVGRGLHEMRFGLWKLWSGLYLTRNTTVKSDDVVGRLKTYESIVKGDNIPEPEF